ncbi:Crp/Fnr family transcriptional regulator [Ramlibacter tataouinensis]|uniref:Crp/Fnr family transcriptional regulator n=1 Tax=Ramlibacter tataouinensis TaxID=94132 RepID=UPI0022F3B43A|nr:Crp/Fnr family transcriptional regulator [Ramlibacter tataouinensis]WBY00216.1 Crp/Fnr family transcriptional regulator [Ramlibacter tataouinensis]
MLAVESAIDIPPQPDGAVRSGNSCELCATRPACILANQSSIMLRALQPAIHELKFRKGDVLLEEGQHSSQVKVIKVGSVFGYRCGLDGASRPIGIAGRGAAFGMFAFFGQPNQVTGIAATAGRACVIAVPALQARARESAVLSEQIAASMARGCGAIAAWSECMRMNGITNQLAYSVLLLSQAQRSAIVELPTHSALAALLGTTRETIARALGTLERQGIIRRLERRLCEVMRNRVLNLINSNAAGPGRSPNYLEPAGDASA